MIINKTSISVLFAIVINAQGPVAQALFLGDPALFNTTREDCVWKRGNDKDHCPDPDITMTLFPSKNSHAKSKVHHSNICRQLAMLPISQFFFFHFIICIFEGLRATNLCVFL